mmetsp:Transcript_19454/g.48653  ORF Transcript_19454/g.48653 Transcript_19454/m.48653 type:complete len:157 (+) Transcript_19454:229-699(+)
MAAAVEANCYDARTMSYMVGGEEADTFLREKLCEQGLKVIEVYAEWAGRCSSVLPLLKRLKTEKDLEESCFGMLHCKAESHPMLAEFNGMSMPHFMFYRNGVLKATVAGANVPQIEKLITDYTPVTADADDLDENPMFVKSKEDKLAAQAEAAAKL